MKGFWTSLLLSIFFCSSISAQFSLLLEGGANYGKSTYVNNDLFNPNEKVITYFFAAIPTYKLANRIHIAAEFQYSLEGYKFGGITSLDNVHLHYIRIVPKVIAKIAGPVHVFVGPNFGYLGSQTTDASGGGRQPVRDRFRHDLFDFGILTGIDLKFSDINFSVKYSFGLRTIYSFEWPAVQSGHPDEFYLRNRFLQLGIGYRIDFDL